MARFYDCFSGEYVEHDFGRRKVAPEDTTAADITRLALEFLQQPSPWLKNAFKDYGALAPTPHPDFQGNKDYTAGRYDEPDIVILGHHAEPSVSLEMGSGSGIRLDPAPRPSNRLVTLAEIAAEFNREYAARLNQL